MDFAQPQGTRGACRIELEGGDALGALFPWFQSGVWVVLPSAMSVEDLLTRHWGLSRDFVESRVGTVFLNGIPVDALDAARLEDGDDLALSGPMPGLAGAILRKNSPLAGLRHKQTHPMHAPSREASEMQRIRVKLFNQLIDDLGPVLLRRGILLERDQLLECLRAWDQSARPKPRRVLWNTEEVTLDYLSHELNNVSDDPILIVGEPFLN
ncbi:MAG: hypothetical protein WHS86_12305 [Desulfosoma sp.]